MSKEYYKVVFGRYPNIEDKYEIWYHNPSNGLWYAYGIVYQDKFTSCGPPQDNQRPWKPYQKEHGWADVHFTLLTKEELFLIVL